MEAINLTNLNKDLNMKKGNEAAKDPDLSGHNSAKFKIVNILTDL